MSSYISYRDFLRFSQKCAVFFKTIFFLRDFLLSLTFDPINSIVTCSNHHNVLLLITKLTGSDLNRSVLVLRSFNVNHTCLKSWTLHFCLAYLI